MNKKAIYGLAVGFSVLITAFIFGTRPQVESAWFLIFFFVTYYMWVYFVVSSIGVFLGISRKKVARLALVSASIITAIQLLITFNALRAVELILISAVLVATGWYVSRAKS